MKSQVSTDKRLRLAVVGARLIGRRHIEAIQQTEAVELAAIVDKDTAAELLARSSGAEYHASLTALLETGKADGIILATPNRLPVEQGLECIAAGFPLLVENVHWRQVSIVAVTVNLIGIEILLQGDFPPGSSMSSICRNHYW